MSFHTCWDVKAPVDTPGVPVPEMLDRLALAFPVHSFDAVGAMADMAKQIAVYKAKVKAPDTPPRPSNIHLSLVAMDSNPA